MNVHVTISIELELLKEFDAWLKVEGFKSRSEALAYLMRSAKTQTKGSNGDFDY